MYLSFQLLNRVLKYFCSKRFAYGSDSTSFFYLLGSTISNVACVGACRGELMREPIACRAPCKNMYYKHPPVQMNCQPPLWAKQKDERGVWRCFGGGQLTLVARYPQIGSPPRPSCITYPVLKFEQTSIAASNVSSDRIGCKYL